MLFVEEYVERIRHFSDETRHPPGSSVEPENRGVHVFANGRRAEDRGYVSVALGDLYDFQEGLTCVVSVLDADGTQRFPTSFAFSSEDYYDEEEDRFRPFLMDRVLRRDTLLGGAHDFLPEDCLTLHVHVTETPWSEEDYVEEPALSFQTPSGSDLNFRLPLDCPLARRLIGSSSYFLGLSSSPMRESLRGYASFPLQEYGTFRTVCRMLVGEKSISMYSVDELLRTYAVADKYDVPEGVSGCRGMLAALLRAARSDPVVREAVADRIPLLLEMAETRHDRQWRAVVEDFLRRSREDEDEDEEGGPADVSGDPPEEWRMERVALGDKIGDRMLGDLERVALDGFVCDRLVFSRGHSQDHLRFYQ